MACPGVRRTVFLVGAQNNAVAARFDPDVAALHHVAAASDTSSHALFLQLLPTHLLGGSYLPRRRHPSSCASQMDFTTLIPRQCCVRSVLTGVPSEAACLLDSLPWKDRARPRSGTAKRTASKHIFLHQSVSAFCARLRLPGSGASITVYSLGPSPGTRTGPEICPTCETNPGLSASQ